MTVAAQNGVATFNNLTLSTSGSYVLGASVVVPSGSSPTATTNLFDVVSGGEAGGWRWRRRWRWRMEVEVAEAEVAAEAAGGSASPPTIIGEKVLITRRFKSAVSRSGSRW